MSMARLMPEQIRAILPVACAWGERFEGYALASGVALIPDQMQDARAAGVAHPEKIRLARIAAIPYPQEGVLAEVNLVLGFDPRSAVGLTLRYGIFIVEGSLGDRNVLAHEFAHVAQYERLGGIQGFLERYLSQCAAHGYQNAPLELEALDASKRICSGAG